MSPVIVACVLAVCLIRVGAVSEPSAENHPTHSPPTPRDICQLPPYNIKNLARKNYWSAVKEEDLESPEIICFDPLATSCTFYFAFCHAIPTQGFENTNCQGATVCQVDEYPNGTVTVYNMGQFSNTTQQFYETNGTVAGSFYVDVVNGTRNTWDAECHTTGISTRIVLECNSTVQWMSQDLTDIIKVKYSEPCSYTITLPYAGACRPATPTPSPSIVPASTTNPVKPTSSPSNLTTSASPPTSPSPHSSKSISPTSPSATSVSTSSTHAHRTSSVGPNPTMSPTPNPPTTTNPENSTTTNPENSTTHHPITHEHPTTPEHPITPAHPTKPHPTDKTTQPPEPVKNDSHVIHGLIAGVVIFALISVVLLVLLIFAGRVIYTKAGPYRRVSNNDDM